MSAVPAAVDDLVRVLVIDGGGDQDARILELLTGLDRAYHIVLVRGLDRGLAALAHQPLDVCLIDHHLYAAAPGLAPLLAITALVPILVVGGPDDDADERAALEGGACDYLCATELDARLLQRSMRHAIARRRALIALQLSERELRATFDAALDAILIADDHGVYVDANPAALELLGITRAELPGWGLTQASPPGTEAKTGALWQAFLERGRDEGEFELSRPDGTRCVVEYRATANVQPGRHLSVLRDLSARRRFEASLVAADRMVTVGTLAAGVAHEVNNPLAAVMTNLEVIAAHVAAHPDAPDAPHPLVSPLDDARVAAEQIRHIVRELKLLSRADDDRSVRIDLHQVLGSALRISANQVRHRATVVRDLAPVPDVIGNESRLGQVFLNLLINAAQAIVEGNAAAHQVRVSTRTTATGEARIEIADTGCGIEPDRLERVFDAFHTTKAIGVGTGLGLSICQRIVSAMGGRIEVTSTAGQGSTFAVILPPAPALPVAPSPAPVPDDASRRGRILVIDDDPLIGRGIRRILTSRHDVTTVASGREALERVRGGDTYDLILCDMMMPEMTGIDVHRELEALAPALTARIVFMTGGAFAPAAKAFLDQSSIRKIDKPFDGATLRGLIAERIA